MRERELAREKDSVGAKIRTFSQTTNRNVIIIWINRVKRLIVSIRQIVITVFLIREHLRSAYKSRRSLIIVLSKKCHSTTSYYFCWSSGGE